MIKEFFKQSAIYTIASVVGRGVSFLLLPFYTRVLTPTDYGTVDILTIFNAFVGVTIALEISQGVARYSADAGSPAERSRYISTAFWFTLIMLTLFALVGSLFARPLTRLVLGAAELTPAFQLTVLSTWSYGCLYFAQNQLRWQLQPKLFALTSLAVLFVSIGSTIYLVLVQRLGVVGVIGGQLLGNSAGAALALYWVRDLLTWTFDWKKFKEMLAFSVPLIPSSVGVVLFTYIDRLAVRELMSVADVGLLGIGYRLASSVGWVMVGFQSAMTPLIYSKYREASTPGEIARIFRYFVAFTLLIFLFQALFAPEILTFFTTPPYYAAAQVIPLLIPSIILAQMYIFAPGLSIAKKTGVIAVINIAGALLNTALNFALIPYLGISGAAAATLVTTAAIFAAYMVYSQRLYFVPHAWKQLGLATLIVVGLLLLGAWVELGFWGNVGLKALLWVSGAAALIWVGLVEPAVFAQVRRQVYARLPGRRPKPVQIITNPPPPTLPQAGGGTESSLARDQFPPLPGEGPRGRPGGVGRYRNAMNPLAKRKSICILALSPVARDGRVLRQIQYLAPHYDLTVVGYGPPHPDLADHPYVAWVEIAPPGAVETGANHPKGGWRRRQAHLRYTLRRILFRLALHAGRRLPAFYSLAYTVRWGYQIALQGKLARRFDAYHANDWNTLPVAAAAAQRHHAKLVVDLHEYAPLEFENLRDWWLFEPLIRAVLQRYATGADALMTVADVIAERYRQELGLDPVVLNAPAYTPPPPKQLDPHHIRLIHHGVAYQIRKPETMIQTIALCDQRYTLHFMLMAAPYIEALKKLATEIAPGRVFFHDAVAPEKIVPTIAQFDVGFNFIAPTNYNYRVCLPNKFFESLMAGLAVCTGPSPSMVEIIEQYGCGVAAPAFEPQALAAVLNQTGAEQWVMMQQAAREAAKELNATHEMQKVVDLYKRLFAEN